MKKSVLKACLLGLLASALTGTSVQLCAQVTNGSVIEHNNTPRKGSNVIPFHGKLKGVNASAQTISVHNVTIQITADTKIDKAGRAATLPDGVVGEIVSGGYKKNSDGTLVATTIHFGPKEPRKPSGKKDVSDAAED